MDEFLVPFARGTPPTQLSPAPQLGRSAQELTTLYRAIFFDQLIDAGEPLRSVAPIVGYHPTTVRLIDAPICPKLHSADLAAAAILVSQIMTLVNVRFQQQYDAAKANRQGRDPDMHKGAIEDERPCAATNAPGLNDDGLPNDETAIAQDALGAREDGSQG